MRKKIWLLVLFLLIIIGQFVALSSFFHTFQAGGIAQNDSIVEISKLRWVYGWATIDIQGASAGYPVSLQFSNSTVITLSSEYIFELRLPRTGDCFCDVSTALPGTNIYIDRVQPVAAAILSNVSSFEIDTLPPSGSSTYDNYVNFYWFIIHGSASVSIVGYGASY
jgi:hypothetical protein